MRTKCLMLGLLVVLGCEEEEPEPSPLPDAATGVDAASGADAGLAAVTASCNLDEAIVPVADNAACAPDPNDYRPREQASAADTWPACISDGNTYAPFSPSVSSLARVGAFEDIGRVLGFGTDKQPSADEFLQARVLYTQEQGIESRVSRREDEHHPAAAKPCNMMTPEEQTANADRCVGPAKIRPILNAAFQAGLAGVDPQLNAARIEAAMLWHFYISAFKEATSAAANAPDVDSMWAKYTGGEPRSSGRGVSRYVRARSLTTHDRVWDGLLAVRCWRDLDNPMGAAMNLELRNRARAQLDRALLRGMAMIVRQRAEKLPCGNAWETVKILGAFLDREATARNPVDAAILRSEVGRADAAQVDRAALIGALDRLFACP